MSIHIKKRKLELHNKYRHDKNISDDTTNVTRARGPIAAMAYEDGRNPNQESRSGMCLLRL
jgi:hypothetical protein